MEIFTSAFDTVYEEMTFFNGIIILFASFRSNVD